MDTVIKGFIIGIGKIIPGVSGSMLAISLGVYEEIIENISNIKTHFKTSIKYLIKPSIGIILAIILTSKIIVKCLDIYYLPTILLFLGMITSGTIQLIKNINTTKIKITPIIISIIIIATIEYINIDKAIIQHEIKFTIIEFIRLIIIGIIDSLASIIPGISGTALLMSLGYYNLILTTFGTLNEIDKLPQNIFILIPFIIGFILGTIILSTLINKIIKTKKEIINITAAIFMIFTLIKLSKTLIIQNQHSITYLIGIITYIIGIYIGNKFNKIEKRIKKKEKNMIK